jgi:hypothetical protein
MSVSMENVNGQVGCPAGVTVGDHARQRCDGLTGDVMQ